ncbi:hypothetical protein [Streptomyces sp. NPDC047869]|uniref:hypothetical protein n=1 Tax=Streptomyces sp. NPDC047869 TaxID=3154709 RepID=UPI00345685B3
MAENLPKPSHTPMAAAALQVLDKLRLHCVITTERWLPECGRIVEHWRTRQECSANEAPQMTTMLGDLNNPMRVIRPDFDRVRHSAAEDTDRTPGGEPQADLLELAHEVVRQHPHAAARPNHRGLAVPGRRLASRFRPHK